ncbi:MAG: hypothetical protein ACFFEN_12290 [Candidatus Thorarchaeota archaeon]
MTHEQAQHLKEKTSENNKKKIDYTIDFITSSAISRISVKFLIFYIPILWIAGYMAIAVFFDISSLLVDYIGESAWIITMLLLPVWTFVSYFIFVFGVAFLTKAFLIMINMIHRPKEGVFIAAEGDQDFEFWRLRVELKKLVFWFMNNGPIPWIVMWGFRWMGIKVDFSSHMQDAWADGGFIVFGRNVTVGQGTVVMSSMVVGKYLIIKKVIFEDHSVIGGVSNIAPGTIAGKESVIGAATNTNPNQHIEPGWIYLGIPARKLKPNKYATERRDLIYKREVDEEVKYVVKQEVNIDEDKRELLNNNKNEDSEI